MKLVESSADVLAASTALAGLVLVFLGATATAYDGYDRTAKPAVRARFRRRAWFAFSAFALCLLSALSALLGEELVLPCAAAMGVGLLVLAIILTAVLGAFTVGEID